ncbi:hypothetical protein MMC09_001755 [Bachmanniomyces sp. S44760]|nr:hypothetical protein [Bachmanniomyces sp. S44760]
MASAGRTAGKWDLQAERKLLLAIIKAANPKPPPWADVANIMDGFTQEACRQRYNKIRKDLGLTGTPNGTPSKPTKTKNVNVTPNGKRKRDITANEDDEEVGIFNDNEDVDIKVKLEPQSRRKSVVKTEETLADGTIDLAQDSEQKVILLHQVVGMMNGERLMELTTDLRKLVIMEMEDAGEMEGQPDQGQPRQGN